VHASPYQESDKFEMYKASDCERASTKQTIFRLFGIPLKVERLQKDTLPFQEKTGIIPATQDDIKSFLQKSKSNTSSGPQSHLELLINTPPGLSSAIYALVENRNDCRKQYQSHKWSIEHVAPVEGKEGSANRFWKKKTKSNGGYIVVLKGERKILGLGPPPPPANWPGGPPPCRKPPAVSSCPHSPTIQWNGLFLTKRAALTISCFADNLCRPPKGKEICGADSTHPGRNSRSCQ